MKYLLRSEKSVLNALTLQSAKTFVWPKLRQKSFKIVFPRKEIVKARYFKEGNRIQVEIDAIDIIYPGETRCRKKRMDVKVPLNLWQTLT